MNIENSNIKIALVGNPNCGKSSIFNNLTGLHQKVGNFPGITIDKKVGKVKMDGQQIDLIDLPGTYSLHPKSAEERVVSSVLFDTLSKDYPDVMVVILDAANLKRNMYLLSQIHDLEIPFLIALNMTDLAKKNDLDVDLKSLSAAFDCNVVITNGKSGKGLDEMLRSAISLVGVKIPPRKKYIGLDDEEDLSKKLKEAYPNQSLYRTDFWFNHWDELDFLANEDKTKLKEIAASVDIKSSERQLLEIGKRYEFIQSIAENIIINKRDLRRKSIHDRADKLLVHPFWGWVIFLFVFFLLFQAVFTIAAFPTDWIDSGMGKLISLVKDTMSPGLFSDFICNGILTGINGIVVFIPQIMILFGLITILEDSGYMARVSFLNDKVLSKFGMNGKSVVPIVGGFACAVPSIMAARSITNRRERLITILITPLMSCSARLPVYVFLIAFLVKDEYLFGFINKQGLFMIGLYLLGVIFSILISALLNAFLKEDKSGIFTLEMPSFKMPRWKNVLMSMIQNGKTFIKEAGKVILIVSMILWAMTSFGPGDSFSTIEANFEKEIQGKSEVEIEELERMMTSDKLEQSYAGILGKAIEPTIRPLGFDWRTGIAVLTSFAAREVFVGTMANIYSVDSDSDNTIEELQNRLMNQNDPKTGEPYMTKATAFSLIIFYVFALQCASTVAVVRKETGGWKWPVIQFVGFTALAWISSFIVYSIMS